MRLYSKESKLEVGGGWVALKPTIPFPLKSEFGNRDPRFSQVTLLICTPTGFSGGGWSLLTPQTSEPRHEEQEPHSSPHWCRKGGRQVTLPCHWPAVEGGVGEDGDVRGELAPDPAKRENRENPHGDQRKTSGMWPELGPTTVWASALGSRVDWREKAGGKECRDWTHDCRRPPQCRARLLPQASLPPTAPHSLPGLKSALCHPTVYAISYSLSCGPNPYPGVMNDKWESHSRTGDGGAQGTLVEASSKEARVLQRTHPAMLPVECRFTSRHTELDRISLLSVWISQAFSYLKFSKYIFFTK